MKTVLVVAAALIDIADIEAHASLIADADTFVTQLEQPMEIGRAHV